MLINKIADEIIKESNLNLKDSGMGFVETILHGGADSKIKQVSSIFNKWASDTKKNFTDKDAKEWGAKNIKDAIEIAKKDLVAYIYNQL